MNLKALLDEQVALKNSECELSYERPDPLMVAKRHNNEYVALICALFGYGSAKKIVDFLDTLDFLLLDLNEDIIKREINSYYRFQTKEDVACFFITLRRLKLENSLEEIFIRGYQRDNSVLCGIYELIRELKRVNSYSSFGYDNLIGQIPKKEGLSGVSPFKRYNMFLRWMVRKDCLDMGLWSKVDKKDLLIPLDVHTSTVSRKLGLLKRKSNDMLAVFELTNKLREFDSSDPIKYDFAIYRLGQNKVMIN